MMTSWFGLRPRAVAMCAAILISILATDSCGKKDDTAPGTAGEDAAATSHTGQAPEIAVNAGNEAGLIQPAAGESTDPAAAGNTAASGAASDAAPIGESSKPAAPIALTRSDVEAYRRGQSAEIAHAESLMSDLMSAPDMDAGRAVLTQLQDTPSRQAAGAEAADMELARYQDVSATVEDILRRWRRANMISHVLADTSIIATMPPDKQARARASLAQAADPYAGLPPATVDIVVPQVESLDSLHVLPGAIVQQAEMLVRNAENKKE